MQVRHWLGIITVSLAAYLPCAHADYVTEAEFAQSGSWAQTLENAINAFINPIDVQMIGNAIYNSPISLKAYNLPDITPTSTPQLDFVTQHMSTYCSPSVGLEATNFQCSGQAGNLSNDKVTAQLLEMGDIRPAVLLEPVMYNQATTYAAINLMRNLTMPFPATTFANFISNQSTFSGNTSQKRAYANYMSNQGLLSVARYALEEIFSSRVAGSYMGATGTAANQSILQIMETEASRRFTDPNYAGHGNSSFLNASSTQQIDIVRDTAAMQAFSLWMQYQSYRQNERIVALLSAILASNVSQTLQGSVAAINAGAPPQ